MFDMLIAEFWLGKVEHESFFLLGVVTAILEMLQF